MRRSNTECGKRLGEEAAEKKGCRKTEALAGLTD
jgi:hypothetical protein